MSTNYFCSGFDIENAFGRWFVERFKNELKDTKVLFLEHFRNSGIVFENSYLIDSATENVKELIDNASLLCWWAESILHKKIMGESCYNW